MGDNVGPVGLILACAAQSCTDLNVSVAGDICRVVKFPRLSVHEKHFVCFLV